MLHEIIAAATGTENNYASGLTFSLPWHLIIYMETNTSETILIEMLADKYQREQGFRILMKQYGPALYWHIRRIIMRHDDKEDVFQNTCVSIFRGISRFKGGSSLLTWMYRIATNESLQHLRRQTRLFQSIDTLADTLAGHLQAEAECDAHAIEMLFQKALLTLPTQQRIAFCLRYYDDMSYADISAVTGKSVGTLKTNYHYAAEKIREYIKKHAQ